jgi:hypothetical protein
MTYIYGNCVSLIEHMYAACHFKQVVTIFVVSDMQLQPYVSKYVNKFVIYLLIYNLC